MGTEAQLLTLLGLRDIFPEGADPVVRERSLSPLVSDGGGGGEGGGGGGGGGFREDTPK